MQSFFGTGQSAEISILLNETSNRPNGGGGGHAPMGVRDLDESSHITAVYNDSDVISGKVTCLLHSILCMQTVRLNAKKRFV